MVEFGRHFFTDCRLLPHIKVSEHPMQQSPKKERVESIGESTDFATRPEEIFVQLAPAMCIVYCMKRMLIEVRRVKMILSLQ